MKKSTNIFLWVLQVLVAAWTIMGAIYMASNYEYVAKPEVLAALPPMTWGIIATLEVLFALGLVLPGMFKVFPKLTSTSAIGIAILFLLGIVLFIAYESLVGMLWGIIPAIILLFIAYKRWPREVVVA